jgi:arylsulfatase A-like enzyme
MHKFLCRLLGGAAVAALLATSPTHVSQAQAPTPAPAPAQPQQQRPNILVIMGDDVGWFNIGAYHRGIMSGKTPNLDKLAAEGMMFTDYYAEASCTAGRAAFITGQLPIRTGLTTVGQAGADVGMPDQAPTIATVLRSMGYTTGQFGKNHLGDLNKYLPCAHGFDEFFGYLYHLDAMEDPFWHSYPQELKDRVGPRNLVHCYATATDDPTVEPRWGKVGKQRIVDEGPLPPHPMQGVKYNMETFDEVVRDSVNGFIDQAKQANKPFFVWMNPTRMHVYTHLSPKYEAMQTPQNSWYTEEAGMAQMDDDIGGVLQHLQSIGELDNTIVVFTTDNGAEVFTWPDGGMTPFAGNKGMGEEGGFRVPAIICWPGHVPAGKVENGIFGSNDWFPTFVAFAGNPNVTAELLNGKQIDGQTFKVHLDGVDQTNVLTGKGPSARHAFPYFTGPQLAAVRIDDWKYVFRTQPEGWFGPKVALDWPRLFNLRLDPFERCWFNNCPPEMMEVYGHEFWRFVYVQQQVAQMGETFVQFPPMQKPASFNLENVRDQILAAIGAAHGGKVYGGVGD